MVPSIPSDFRLAESIPRHPLHPMPDDCCREKDILSSSCREASRHGFPPDGFNPVNGLGGIPQPVERYYFLVSPS